MRLRAAAVAFLAFSFPQISQACSVCFGNSKSNLTEGANNAIIFLLAIVAFVQIGFVSMFVMFWRRQRALRRFKAQFRVIGGGSQ